MPVNNFNDLVVGMETTHTRTVSDSAVDAFAEITGDDDPIHIDEAYAAATSYGRRIAPGALLIGYMMAASTKATYGIEGGAASVGFDRIRHVAPVFLGDTVTVHYQIVSKDAARRRAVAAINVVNQHNETVAVADHILKVL